jgi:hypothetical protein
VVTKKVLGTASSVDETFVVHVCCIGDYLNDGFVGRKATIPKRALAADPTWQRCWVQVRTRASTGSNTATRTLRRASLDTFGFTLDPDLFGNECELVVLGGRYDSDLIRGGEVSMKRFAAVRVCKSTVAYSML